MPITVTGSERQSRRRETKSDERVWLYLGPRFPIGSIQVRSAYFASASSRLSARVRRDIHYQIFGLKMRNAHTLSVYVSFADFIICVVYAIDRRATEHIRHCIFVSRTYARSIFVLHADVDQCARCIGDVRYSEMNLQFHL